MIRDFKIDVFSASGNILRTIESRFFKVAGQRGFIGIDPVHDKFSVQACHDKISINIDSRVTIDSVRQTAYSATTPSAECNLGGSPHKLYSANIGVTSLFTDSATVDSTSFHNRTDGTYLIRPTRLWR